VKLLRSRRPASDDAPGLPPTDNGLIHQHQPSHRSPRPGPVRTGRLACSRRAGLAQPARTRAYVERRTKEGLSKPEIMRCIKRYLAREIYHALVADFEALHAT
jgi:transposase